MGWYKVPRSSFDYAPAALDLILMDQGIKEPEEHKISTTMLVRFEWDARTMSLIGSFIDVSGAAAASH